MGFRRDSAYLFSLTGVNLAAGLVTSVLVARLFGPEGKGVLTLLILLPQFATSLGGLGIRAATIYFTGKGFNPRQVFKKAAGLGLVLAAVYLLAAWVFRGFVEGSLLKGLERSWVLVSMGLIPAYLLWAYADGVLQGMKRFGAYSAVHAGADLLKVLGLAAVGLLALGLEGAVGVYAATAVLPALLTCGLVWRWARSTGAAVRLRSLLRYGLAGHLGTVAQRANLRLDVFLLNPVVGPAGVGIYSVATLLAELIWKVPDALSQALLPRVAEAGRVEGERLTRIVCRAALALTVSAALMLALAAPLMVRLVFGPEFAASITPLWWLLPGVVALTVSKVLTKYLSGIGRPVLNSFASIASLIVNVPALVLLVPQNGVAGAAQASSLAYLVHAIVVVFFFTRETGTGVWSALIPQPGDTRLVRQLWQDARARVRSPRNTPQENRP